MTTGLSPAERFQAAKVRNRCAAACSSIEAFVFMSAVLVGVVLSALIRLEFSWGPAVAAPMGLVLVAAVQLRRHWVRLQALHTGDRDD